MKDTEAVIIKNNLVTTAMSTHPCLIRSVHGITNTVFFFLLCVPLSSLLSSPIACPSVPSASDTAVCPERTPTSTVYPFSAGSATLIGATAFLGEWTWTQKSSSWSQKAFVARLPFLALPYLWRIRGPPEARAPSGKHAYVAGRVSISTQVLPLRQPLGTCFYSTCLFLPCVRQVVVCCFCCRR